jgi:hypothetical protein
MTDEQGWKELQAEMDREEMVSRARERYRWFAEGARAGMLQALEDVANSETLDAAVQTLAARLAPVIGRDQ